MTIRELKKEVEMLGFADLCELEDYLIPTANRALNMIHTRHPKIRLGELNIPKQDVIFKRDSIDVQNSDATFIIPEGTLFIKASGRGKYTYRDGVTQRSVSFNTESTEELKVVFKVGGEITFHKSSDYMVWDLQVFQSIPERYREAVSKFGRYICYDMKKLFPDLMYVVGAPTREDLITDTAVNYLDATTMMIAKSFHGPICVCFRASNLLLTKDMPEDTEIDISAELCPLLPLLVAHFLWLDDQPDKAKEYLSKYESLSKEIKEGRRPRGAGRYLDTNRWC